MPDRTRDEGRSESPLRWMCKSTRTVAGQLSKGGHPVSHVKVAQLLHDQGYSLQSNRKTEEGADHPDRDAQFRHINARVKRALAARMPVISVDTKKKELIGNYVNGGHQWLLAKHPKKVNGHDFPHPDVPRAYPYGVYDLGRNVGFVNVGTDHDTGAFAVRRSAGGGVSKGSSCIGRHANLSSRRTEEAATGIVCACGSWSCRNWQTRQAFLFRFRHFPPGTSKWNKIEHRLFSFISSNWRGEPLRDYETVVHLISRTRTAKGLKVSCRLDRRKYPTGAR